MKEIFVIDAGRTAVGKYGGALSSVRPDDLLAHVIKTLVARNPSIDPNAIEEVIAGAANQAGEDNRNVARMAALLADLPTTVGGNTVNRLCASGLQSIMDASRAIYHGDGNIYIAGGVESMSRAPFVTGKATTAFARNTEQFDTTIGWRFINPKLAAKHPPFSMGETAENVAEQWKISREDQDIFAFQSQSKYAAAAATGKFNLEIIPYKVELGKGKSLDFSIDEHPRLSTVDQLAELKPAFKKEGTVTAGNSSGINDGAAAMILADGEAVKKYNLNPIARIKSMAIAGVDPAIMGVGPIPATLKALERAQLTIADLDLIELNEAFASQSIACMRDLNLNPQKVNVNGGSIAIGHPLGASGTRIATTLLYEMQKTKSQYGLATMCIGVGQGAAIIFENLIR